MGPYPLVLRQITNVGPDLTRSRRVSQGIAEEPHVLERTSRGLRVTMARSS